jgi:cytochrome c biogenesis factor
MVYGVVCFGLLFSIVGTILGGVWANESWGRFWGWDPKENGALMIVLWNIVMLHGRVGGYTRDFGLCMMAVFGNIVVAFSWWGVNLLGVGLHSYGFTAGIQKTLNSFYAVEAGIVMLGAVAWVLQGRMATTPATKKTEAAAAEG